jgi:hypothetical protein
MGNGAKRRKGPLRGLSKARDLRPGFWKRRG